MRCLLDKAIARFAVQGILKLGEDRALSSQELLSLDLVLRVSQAPNCLFIVPPTAGVIRRLADLPRYSPVVSLFLGHVQVAIPARYFKRWARRLRDLGFTPEDAAVLALATFGTDAEAATLGMDVVATGDQPMINNWLARQSDIQQRLSALQQDIPAPYRYARLPDVLRPEQVVIET